MTVIERLKSVLKEIEEFEHDEQVSVSPILSRVMLFFTVAYPAGLPFPYIGMDDKHTAWISWGNPTFRGMSGTIHEHLIDQNGFRLSLHAWEREEGQIDNPIHDDSFTHFCSTDQMGGGIINGMLLYHIRYIYGLEDKMIWP